MAPFHFLRLSGTITLRGYLLQTLAITVSDVFEFTYAGTLAYC
jgi:hypothetical protein